MMVSNRNLLFRGAPIFRFHVCFWGSIRPYECSYGTLRIKPFFLGPVFCSKKKNLVHGHGQDTWSGGDEGKRSNSAGPRCSFGYLEDHPKLVKAFLSDHGGIHNPLIAGLISWGKRGIAWRIIPFSKWLITMVSFRPLSRVMGPLINGRTSCLINGGDPNYLQVLG